MANHAAGVLKMSDLIFKDFFENSAIGMSITSPDGTILTNNAFCEILGYSQDEISRIKWMNLTHPDDIENDHEIVRSMVSGERSSAHWQKRYIRKNGEVIHVDISSVIHRNEDGTPQYFITTVSDITERIRLQEIVARSEAAIRESQAIAQLGSYYFNLLTGHWESSEILDGIFGIDNEYVRSFEGWGMIIHPDWRQQMLDYVNLEVIGNRQPFDKEYQIIRQSDREERWLHGLGRLDFDTLGNPVALIGTILDITSRKKAEIERWETNEKLRILTDNLSGFVAYVNATTLKYEFVNAMFEKSFGMPRERIIGSKIKEIIGEENFQFALKYINEVRKGNPVSYENTFNLVDGQRWVKVNYTPVFDVRGAVSSIIAHSYDITERKQMEMDLEEGRNRVDRQRNAIAALVSDEAIISGDLDIAVVRITEMISAAFQVERTSIWMMSDDKKQIQCISLYEKSIGKKSAGSIIMTAEYPAYFKALSSGRIINASDARTDPRTKDFAEVYLIPYGIESMLDVPVILEGELVGVLCFENAGGRREWHTDEEAFATAIASFISQTIINGKRRKSEEALRDSEDRYRLLMDTLPDGVIVHSQGKLVFANQAGARLIGASSPEDILNLPVMDFVHPDYREMIIARIRKSLSEKVPLPPAEEKFLRLDGSVIDVEVAAVPITYGGLPALLTVISDITSRKKAEEKIAEEQNLLRTLLNLLPTLVYVKDKDGKFVDANFACAEYIGERSPSDLIGKSDNDYYPPEVVAEFRKDELQVMKGVPLINKEETSTSAPGNPRYFLTSKVPLHGKDGKISGLLGTSLDITEHKKAEIIQLIQSNIARDVAVVETLGEMLMTVRNELLRIMDSTNFFVALYNPDSDTLRKVVFVDEKDEFTEWKADSSLSGQVVKSKKTMMLNREDVLKFSADKGLKFLGTPAECWLGVPLIINSRAEGVMVVQSYTDSSAYNAGSAALLEMVAHELSLFIERKKMVDDLVLAKEKAEESDRLKTTFLANMSHEIRTPLNSIIGFSDLLTEDENVMSEVLRFAGIIKSSGLRLLELISNLMDISKIESGTERIRVSSFLPAIVVRDVITQFDYHSEKKSIQLKENIPESLIGVTMDTDIMKLQQVLTNLINNALKFTEKGSVEVGLEKTEEGILFYIKDTGIGIPQDHLERVFDRFYQVDATTIRRFEGAGLGLSLCKGMVELLGGRIWAESRVGTGSKFSFVLPISLKP